MTDPSGDQHGKAHSRSDELRSQMKAAQADLQRQFESTRAQFDAANEKIEARTGRNLVLAIAIGLAFGLAMLFSLILVKWVFLIFAAFMVLFAAYELATALRRSDRLVPVVPVVAGSIAMIPLSWFFGGVGQWLGLMAAIALTIIWRLVSAAFPGRRRDAAGLARDIGAAILVLVYVGLFASFTALLLVSDGGQWWVLAFLILVIVADTAAYASGLAFGRHPMAPVISPKKTWEGFAGAVAACLVGGVLLAVLMLHTEWWFGLVFGVVILLSATLGDLTESLIKRDLGIKDMSSWLPGHGGFLDRLDSILPSAVAAYALLIIFG